MKSSSKVLHGFKWIAAVFLMAAYNLANAGGLHLCPIHLGLTMEEENRNANAALMKSLDGINLRLGEVGSLKTTQEAQAKAMEDFTKILAEVKAANETFRKQMLTIGSQRARRGGEVSHECALHLGAIGLIAALKTPSADLKPHQIEMAERQIKSILNIEAKAALTTSDIPLPVAYSSEVVELVYEYGQARKVGTVFPLGAGTVKLPKLGTDPAFGLIGGSVTVPEKSPTIVFVTFSAEKFGGLIRLPSEIDEDSIVAMGQFIARYSARNIALVEDWQFFRSTGAASGVNGTGAGLTTAVVTDACLINQASTKIKQSDATLANFRSLRSESTLSGAVLGRAKYYMHPTYEALLVSFNTNTNGIVYVRGNGTAPATLDGFPIEWIYTMPAYSTAAAVSLCHVLFGDATYQYLGVRGSIRMDTSREAAFATDEILMRALERLTVGLMASKAVAGLVTAAS